ncbi:unnamed protein product, partial [Rhizoctonia solani]
MDRDLQPKGAVDSHETNEAKKKLEVQEQVPTGLQEQNTQATRETNNTPGPKDLSHLEEWNDLMVNQINALKAKIGQEDFTVVDSDSKSILRQLEPTKAYS